jgi:hypothetical protein
MVSVLALSVVDSGFEPGRVNQRLYMKSKFTVIFETKTNVSPQNAV